MYTTLLYALNFYSTMSHQIVLMTGCSSGIGLATARRLVHDPDHRFVVIATVIAMSENTDLVNAVGDALDKTVFIKELDITEDEKIKEVVDDVIKSHGRIDILLNIAGMPCLGIIERITLERINQVFRVNLIGAIRLTQAVLPSMKQKKSGKILTVSSATGRLGAPYSELYVSSKFALEGFFECLAVSLRAFNIRVCLIEPAATDTRLLAGMDDELSAIAKKDDIDEIDRHQLTSTRDCLLGLPSVQPEDIAEAMVTRCLDVEEPALRHLLISENSRYADTLHLALADMTGEVGVSIASKFFGPS